MDKDLKAYIEYMLGVKLVHIRPISGGDISQAYLLESTTERFFCKVNHGLQAYEMFLAEKWNLEAISKTNTIATPKIRCCETLEIGGFLLMEYLEPKRASVKEMALFGHQMGALHKSTKAKQFGWETDNFIGSLPQSNRQHLSWTDFYVKERLLPQLKMASDLQRLSKTEIPSEVQLLKTCESLFPLVKPSLLHGDLWGGNYLIAHDGMPYLIDPAAYFGHCEVDIAMTRLFGGFDAAFYHAYSEHFPKAGGEKERNDIYQLYYLLVHLNLFGVSYKTSVMEILKNYC